LANGTGSGGAGSGPPGPGDPGDRASAEQPDPGQPAPPSGRPASQMRSWVDAPLGSRLIGAVLAVVGVALLVIGLITVRGRSPEDGSRPGAAPATSASASATSSPITPGTSSTPSTSSTSSPAPTSGSPSPTATPSRPPARTTAAPRPAAPRAPLTVLNNSKVNGLGERVADQARGKDWPIALVGNFAGRIPVTTIYFTPGDAAGERAARQFAAEFPAVQRVFPRYVGLPPTPDGIVLVVTRDWLN
jgi:LytR cell envelope-related transcriptional attenuator